MYASLFFCNRNALHTVYASLVPEGSVCVCSLYLKSRIIDHAYFPTFYLSVFLVHITEFCGKQARFVSACAPPPAPPPPPGPAAETTGRPRASPSSFLSLTLAFPPPMGRPPGAGVEMPGGEA